MHHPYLVGEKVYLRALERSDLSGPMFDWANDPEVTHFMYMGWVPNTEEALAHEYDVLRAEGTASLLQLHWHPTTIIFAVINKETETHIGNVGLFDISWVMRVAEFRAIFGDRQHWGRFAAEAYKLALAYAFDRLNLRRIIAGTRADNVRSVVNLRKLGFVQEGLQREHFLRNDQPYDIVTFGLLRREFFALFPTSEAPALK